MRIQQQYVINKKVNIGESLVLAFLLRRWLTFEAGERERERKTREREIERERKNREREKRERERERKRKRVRAIMKILTK